MGILVDGENVDRVRCGYGGSGDVWIWWIGGGADIGIVDGLCCGWDVDGGLVEGGCGCGC